jgi:hypothetical protein
VTHLPNHYPSLKKKPGIQTGFAIRSPDTLLVCYEEATKLQVLGHCILSLVYNKTELAMQSYECR